MGICFDGVGDFYREGPEPSRKRKKSARQVAEQPPSLRAACPACQLSCTLAIVHQCLPKFGEKQLGGVALSLQGREEKGEIVKLTPTEYALLSLFVRNAGKVLTHRYILQQIWGPTFEDETQYSRVYIAQLRKKLEDNPSDPQLFVTESGIGYRLSVDA